jgi:DNA repair protein RadA/Sms
MLFCTECGAETPKWSGKCPACGSWNTLKEASFDNGSKRKNKKRSGTVSEPESLAKMSALSTERMATKNSEFDTILGGGLVEGMAVLIGGEPGIGKSTLVMQIANQIARQGKNVLYVSGEESKEQIFLRCHRLGTVSETVFLSCETNIEEIMQQVERIDPELLIIDSIQSIYADYLESAPGNLGQIRECAFVLTKLAKQRKMSVFIIGHVTKDGYVAGPKVIEHMVDTVLYFEIEQQYRILRATKNRFGSTNEIGIFEMQTDGLKEVLNPSYIFIGEDEHAIGAAVGSMLEGSRAFLTEVQALVSPANYGTPQRVSLGVEQKKLAVILAVLEKNLGLNLRNNDVFVKLAGGRKTVESSLDLPMCAAILSSFRDQKTLENMLFIGEVGLNGEIRPVSQLAKRLKEGHKLGFKKAIVSYRSEIESPELELIKIRNIREIMPVAF